MKFKKAAIISLVLLIASAFLLGSVLNRFRKYKRDHEVDSSYHDVIWYADFQDQEPGVFDFRDIKREFGSYGLQFGRNLGGIGILQLRHPGLENDQNIIIEEEEGNKFSRNWFKGGHYGIIDQDHHIGSGHFYQPRIPGKHEELWISHNIRWPQDRDWALSGSMGVSVSGGTTPPACNPYEKKSHNGFLINLMWSKGREMKLSLHWPGKNDSLAPCGISGPFKWDDPHNPESRLILTDYSDQWHNIALRIVLNDNYTPGKGNGMIEGFWDGRLAFRVDTLRLRTEPGVYIDHARAQLNHGGNDHRFSPDRDTYVDVDDVWTWTWKKESGLPSGYTPWNQEDSLPLPNYPKNN